jgi:hypothetical protein
MIITEFYNGQGLGNQLWCYVVVRLVAERNGYEFGIMSPERFKGKDFIDLDFGRTVFGGSGPEGGPPSELPRDVSFYYREKIIRHPCSGLDVSCKDNALLSVSDCTKIDGAMQSFEYVKDHRHKAIQYLHAKKINEQSNYLDNDSCIIHIRGGDFKGSSAMLYSDYYVNAMNYFRDINSSLTFYVVTDDVNTAKQILPTTQIIGSSLTNISDMSKASHHLGGPIGIDYSILNSCKNVIMSASSFGWWPVWTNENDPVVVAPKYWAAHKVNGGYWSCGESLIDGWNFIDINGVVTDSETCKREMYEKI